MDQWRRLKSEKMLRPQQAEPPRPIGQDAFADHADVGQRWKQQGVCPNEESGSHAGTSSEGGTASPQQASEESRCQLGNGCEGKQANRRELCYAGRTIVKIGQEEDRED